MECSSRNGPSEPGSARPSRPWTPSLDPTKVGTFIIALRVCICYRDMGLIILSCSSDNAIQSNVLESPWFQSSRRLCAYISCSALREVDTSKLLSEILQNPATGVCCLFYLLENEMLCDFLKRHLLLNNSDAL